MNLLLPLRKAVKGLDACATNHAQKPTMKTKLPYSVHHAPVTIALPTSSGRGDAFAAVSNRCDDVARYLQACHHRKHCRVGHHVAAPPGDISRPIARASLDCCRWCGRSCTTARGCSW
eukprot:scaffold4370_cov317-Prasinococcus_capsulatus_cf.AAC.3